MERILHITDSMGMGGIQAFIMNVYRNIDRTQVQFDFMLNHRPEKNYDDEIMKLGGKIFYLPARNKGIIKNRKALTEFFDRHKEYRVVHMHESSLSYIEPLIAAKNSGVSTRIIHAHSTKASGNIAHTVLHWINRTRISQIATCYFACGELAKQWMFGTTKAFPKARVVNNGIKIKDYEFNSEIRLAVRKELGLENSYVIGHVGRFSSVKNHEFLIQVFCYIKAKKQNSKLVLVGDGELRAPIYEKVIDLGLADSVLFLGNRSDVNMLLQAFDVVIIPSLYEGFPVCAIEAQASGVPCMMSDTITSDASIKSNTVMYDLAQGPEWWADHVITSQRETSNKCLYEAGYDIEATIKQLMNVYVMRG